MPLTRSFPTPSTPIPILALGGHPPTLQPIPRVVTLCVPTLHTDRLTSKFPLISTHKQHTYNIGTNRQRPHTFTVRQRLQKDNTTQGGSRQYKC